MSLLWQLEEQARQSARQMGGHVTTEGSIRPALPRLADDHLTRMVCAADEVPERTRSGGNAEGLIHISSLVGAVCERDHVLSQRHRMMNASVVTGGHKVMWKIGRAVEKHVRTSIISARGRRNVYGVWQCRCGHTEHLGEHPQDMRCERCWSGLGHYREPQLVDAVRKVTGSPDLTLIEKGLFLVSEIKSMNKEDFDALEAPLADHVIQACGYHRLYEMLGFPMLPQVRLFYVRKQFLWGGRNRIYKEFTIDPATYARQVDLCFEAAERIRDHVEAGTTPDRIRPCRSARSTRAKECNSCATCWQL